jgi:hypothetical protein
LIKNDDDIGYPVALLWEGGGTHGKPRQIARAHLIAAAPQLLEALKKLFEEHRRVDPHHNHLCDDCKDAERAIAQAEGRSLQHLRSDADWSEHFLLIYYPELVKLEGRR